MNHFSCCALRRGGEGYRGAKRGKVGVAATDAARNLTRPGGIFSVRIPRQIVPFR